MSRGLLIAAVLSLCLQACGRSMGGAATAALTLSPQARTVVAGSAPVPFTATLTGAGGPISWTLSGPGALDAATGATISYTPPAAVDAPTTATVTASAGAGLTAQGTLTVVPAPPATIDVAGRVVGIPGNGIPGLTIAIAGKTSVTDSDGRFSIAGVTPPYDLAIVFSGTPPMAGVYQGLTRPDPALTFLFFVDPGETHTATISGTVSGGDPIPSAGEFTGALFASPEATGAGRVDSSGYAFALAWFGPATTTGTVHVLQWKAPRPGDPATAYTAFGTVTALRVTDGQSVSVPTMRLYDPGASSVSGEIVPPPGYGLLTRGLDLEYADDAIQTIADEVSSDPHFTYQVPGNITLTAVVSATAELADAGVTSRRESGIPRGATGLTIALAEPALLSAPEDGTSGVSPSTDFRWSPLAGGVHLVIFNGEANRPSYFVVTRETSTRIPDLSSLGAALPPASAYSWLVVGFAPFATVDDYVATGTLIPPLGNLDQTISAFRRFTTRSP